MESPHPDERPSKKRRFFTEDSSPAQVRATRPSPRPATPPPAVASHEEAQGETNGDTDAGTTDGFDVGMLQAVVGELSASTLQKLKDVSGNNVERGLHATGEGRLARSDSQQQLTCTSMARGTLHLYQLRHRPRSSNLAFRFSPRSQTPSSAPTPTPPSCLRQARALPRLLSYAICQPNAILGRLAPVAGQPRVVLEYSGTTRRLALSV
jgi:hypothetical protein